MIIIRPISSEDTEAFLSLQLVLDAETSYMMLEPGERSTSIDDAAGMIASIKRSGEIFLAEENRTLAGYLSLQRESFQRNQHSAYIIIGILQAFRGQGIGTRLFKAAETWARAHTVHRLDLTVMVHNTAGVALYQKMGFEIEGLKRHSLFVDGQYVDEYFMSKLLN